MSETTDLTTGEIAFQIRREFVETVSDIVLRRTSLAIDGSLTADIVDRVTELFRTERDLSAEEARKMRDELLVELNDFHGVSRQMLEHRNMQWSKECV